MAIQIGFSAYMHFCLLNVTIRRDKKWKASRDADRAEYERLLAEYPDLL
jgi:hypothetical protein